MLSKHSGLAEHAIDDLPAEHGTEDGVWINADPVKGCVVVNIGESELPIRVYLPVADGMGKCGKYGRMDCTRALFIA